LVLKKFIFVSTSVMTGAKFEKFININMCKTENYFVTFSFCKRIQR